mgnify:CR=1 FL=1
MSTKAKIRAFFGANREYVVTGASNNPSKFGFKILSWYVSHDLPVVPINPKESQILNQEVVASVVPVLEAVKARKDVGSHKLSTTDSVSISFLTPPRITVATLKQIASVDGYKGLISGLWFQPGSYDQEVLDTVDLIGLEERAIHEDECILVRGDEGLYAANL